MTHSYIRRRGEAHWHFCRSCIGHRSALNKGLERRNDRPPDVYLCDECLALERSGYCGNSNGD